MTAKRFKLSYPNGAFLIDGDKPLCSIENDLMIVDKLNELVEENKELKKENEQLKQRNDFLREQLDRVCIDNETMGDKLKQIGRIL